VRFEARVQVTRNVYKTLLDGKISLRRYKYRWESNIKIYFKEIGCGSVTGIQWARCRDHCWAVVNLRTDLEVL
jgi:hypothetical protein